MRKTPRRPMRFTSAVPRCSLLISSRTAGPHVPPPEPTTLAAHPEPRKYGGYKVSSGSSSAFREQIKKYSTANAGLINGTFIFRCILRALTNFRLG